MNTEIKDYNDKQADDRKPICDLLADVIQASFPRDENKIWHGAPVWFINGNPIVGYDVQKKDVRLLFWSGQTFGESGLSPEGRFKAAEAHYTDVDQINIDDLKKWLQKSKEIQWDYKNIVQRKGKLTRLS